MTAGIAAVRKRAHPQLEDDTKRRTIIAFRPFAEIRPHAFRTARIADQRRPPERREEALPAMPATERKDAQHTAEPFGESAHCRGSDVLLPAVGAASEGHLPMIINLLHADNTP